MKLHHHYAVRKRLSAERAGLEPYPSSHLWLRLLDRMVYIVGIIGPVMVLPQIYLIFSTQNASGVSAISWLSWALLDIPWIFYGLAHKQYPIVLTYLLWFICNLVVFFGALIY